MGKCGSPSLTFIALVVLVKWKKTRIFSAEGWGSRPADFVFRAQSVRWRGSQSYTKKQGRLDREIGYHINAIPCVLLVNSTILNSFGSNSWVFNVIGINGKLKSRSIQWMRSLRNSGGRYRTGSQGKEGKDSKLLDQKESLSQSTKERVATDYNHVMVIPDLRPISSSWWWVPPFHLYRAWKVGRESVRNLRIHLRWSQSTYYVLATS